MFVVTVGMANTAQGQVLPFDGATTYSAGTSPFGLVAADVNDDQLVDLVVAQATTSGQVLVFLNSLHPVTLQPGAFEMTGLPIDLSTQFGAHDIDVVEFNGDAFVDLAVALHGNGAFCTPYGDGSGGFPTCDCTDLSPDGPSAIVGTELDGDALGDLVVPHSTLTSLQVCFGDGNGGTKHLQEEFIGEGQSSADVGLLDGDALLDIALTHGSTVQLLYRDAGTMFDFVPGLSFPTAGQAAAATVADVDLDGDDDVLATDIDNGLLHVMLSDGAGGFVAAAPVAIPVDAQYLAIADLNDDGLPDVATAHVSLGELTILAGDGAGGFAQLQTLSGLQLARSVVAADFNGDGRPDLAVTDGLGSELVVYLNKWADLNSGCAPAAAVVPVFRASGSLEPGSAISLVLTDAPPFLPATLVVGTSILNAPFGSCTLVPSVDLLQPSGVDGSGSIVFNTTWPPGVPPGIPIHMQWWMKAPAGWFASNAVSLTTP